MMRILVAISLIALITSCAHKDAGKGLNRFSGRNPDAENTFSEATEASFDSTFFIGYVDYFPDTKEFYTALFYREGHEYPDEELLESRLDSVIVLEDDWGRERLPMEEARRLLILSGLDTISIYNRRHELVCKTSLARVEYLWNGMESYFIAVFKSDMTDFVQTEELYGVSSDYPISREHDFSVKEFADPLLNEVLINQLRMSRAIEWDMRHFKFNHPDAIFSIVSSYSMDKNESRSYLTAFENNEVRILNEEIDNFHFLNILPVPVLMNGKPLMLISAGYPSSDVIWDFLAGFDGTRYESLDYNRVPLIQPKQFLENAMAVSIED